MNNLNSILVEGNLVRDPELSYTPKAIAVCKFSVGCNRSWKQDDEVQKEVSFFDITAWNRLAETCGEYLKKGRGVRVVGRLKQDRWTDQEGKQHSRVLIIAEHVEFKPQFKKQPGDDTQGAEGAGTSETAEAEEEEEAKKVVSF